MFLARHSCSCAPCATLLFLAQPSLLIIATHPVFAWCCYSSYLCLMLLLLLFLLNDVAFLVLVWCCCSSCCSSCPCSIVLLLLSLFDAATLALLAQHCSSFLLAQCCPFFFFVQHYCSFIPCSTLLFLYPCLTLLLLILWSALWLLRSLLNVIVPMFLAHPQCGLLPLWYLFAMPWCCYSYVPCVSPLWVALTLVPFCSAVMLLLLCSLRLLLFQIGTFPFSV